MLKAKLDSVRKNKKGFSLVELIIVMAIMVALIAVLAPQFVKYVQRARDSSVADAAENVYEMAKSEYALGNLSGTGDIVVCSVDGNGVIGIKADDTLTYKIGTEEKTMADFYEACGVDGSKTVNSQVMYTITISEGPNFAMAKSETGAADAGVTAPEAE